MIIKTIVPAIGSVNSYRNKPVKDYSFGSSDNRIGEIIDVNELSEGYELTMKINDVDIRGEFNGNRLRSISISK